MNLPDAFLEKMRILLGDEELEKYKDSLKEDRVHGIRLNNKKGSSRELTELLERAELVKNCQLRRVPWIPNGYFAENTSMLSSHPYYRAGLYYIQEPSAMTPAAVLPVKPGDMVLDMCAAPGGKATQLAACLSYEGFLLANDISASRGKALLKNLEMAGADRFCVTAQDPKKLAEVYPEFFDKILLDAPCSGEGMFRRDPKGIGAWLEKGPDFYGAVQEELLKSAAAMLKPGGMLIYSTCTFDIRENEEQILKLMAEHPEFETCPIENCEGFTKGKQGVDRAVRIFPHKMEGEGHFLCLLRKKGECSGRPENKKKNIKGLIKELPDSAAEFLSHAGYDFSKGIFIREKERIYFLGENVDKNEALRYLRTGLFIGTEEKGRFEPSQAFAMVLNKDSFDMCIDYPCRDIHIEKYIKGESFPTDTSMTKGFPWRLICVDGYPLGWAKHSGNMLKNKYDISWRKV